MRFFKYPFVYFLFLVILSSCSQKKINGVNLVAPPQKIELNDFLKIKKINANWISIIPYGLSKGYSPDVYFNSPKQWWGERTTGIIETIKLAKKQNLKIMLKPHLWFGWGKGATEFTLQKEEDWLRWEKSYTKYIVTFAKIAEEKDVDLFCFSTELKQVVLQRPSFFKKLIKTVKQVYKGKLTYAANWDNYENVTFWEDVNYIGIDAYFPLSDEKEPVVEVLNRNWKPIKQKLKEVSEKVNKPVLFTEYGFESCDYNTKKTWGSDNKYDENQQTQLNGYQSLYDTFYDENWFAGGFLWKWHLTNRTMRNTSKSFTPQGKKAMSLIEKQFREN